MKQDPQIRHEDIALVSSRETYTYGQMIDAADGIGEQVEERSLVFVLGSNTIGAICGYLGFLRRRAIIVMLNAAISADQLSDLLERYEPQYLWMPEERAASFPECADLYSLESYRLLEYGETPCTTAPELAMLLTTSGSTGSPKFVRLSYANLAANARSIARYQRLSPADRAITTLPLSYSYGISIVNSHLLSGASLAVCDESIMNPRFWDFIRESKASNFGGVPYTYQMLDRLRFDRRELPALRFISQAGGPLGQAMQERFAGICADKGIEFFVMYGQTEATARMSWLPPEHAASKLGSIGIPIPDGSFELKDIATGELIEDADKEGELVYRGPNVSLGYASCREDLSKPDENRGRLATGDVARRDEDGFYYITGRLKRFLKMFGNRVSLDEVERLLEGAGFTAAATGEDNRMRVFTTAEDTQTVRAFLARETGIHPSGLFISHVNELPRTSSGKIDYHRLAENATTIEGG